MKRHAAHRWLIWLLPLLVLRSFVPAGFMLAATGGDLQMMLCAGFGPVTMQAHGVADHRAHADHAQASASQHEHHGSTSPQAHENSLCPFAAAGSSGISMPAHAVVAFATFAAERFDFLAHPELRSRPVLIDRIRGPPHA